MLLAIDLYEDFIDEEGVAEALVFPLQSSGVYGSKFNAPEPDALVADSDPSLGQ
jgi:hypothetical protein